MGSMIFRPDIQGLRAIAVLAVIVFHLNSAWLPGGFVGVDVFLVISGFLISSILLHKKDKSGYKLLSTLNYFYTSRIKRIAPAYYTTLIIVTLIAAVLFIPKDFSTFSDGLNKAVWFNSNNYFANFGDYFASANYEQPLLHTWSLAIEIQFYLIAPIIFLLLPKRLLKWFLPITIVGLTAYAEYQLHIAGNEQATYYSLLARLPAFLLGAWVSLFIAKKNKSLDEERYKPYLTWLAVGLIFVALLQPKLTGYFPGIAGLIPITGAALIIFLNTNNVITQLLSNRSMVWVGSLSYSLYLWHWPVLAFMRYYTGAEILNWQYSFAFIVLTLSLAIASHYLIERPLRFKGRKKQIVGYASLILLLVLTFLGMAKINSYYTPKPLPVEYTRSADPALTCHGRIIGDCLWGDKESSKEVLVIGDSHANMLSHFFKYLGEELNFKARIITASSCVTIPGFDYKRIAEWAHKPCLSQIEEVQKYLDKAETVFLAASWNWQLQSKAFDKALNYFLAGNSSSKIYIVGQEPLLFSSPVRNIRFSYINLPNGMRVNDDYLKTNQVLKDIANQYEQVIYLDFSKLPIFQTVPVYKGEIIYRDSHHIHSVAVTEYAKQALPIVLNTVFDSDLSNESIK
jgi:peptidoglycan/LPS O-acetylase OafA/YrhL